MSGKQCLVSHDQAVEIEGRRTEKEALFEREGRIKCLQEERDTCFVYFFFFLKFVFHEEIQLEQNLITFMN